MSAESNPEHWVTEETIGGRAYRIEAARVGGNRWRARIVRMPGMPTALMPFYGSTADEAALHLRQWLEMAHRAASSAGPGKPRRTEGGRRLAGGSASSGK
jgi:hypothetical protein